MSFFTGSDQPVVEALVAEFNASQDEVEVEFLPTPGDVIDQKIMQSIAGGDAPDIVSVDSMDLAKYVEAGAVQAIDDYYSDPANETAALTTAAVGGGSYDAVHYGAPISFFTAMLLWNKGLFEAAGLDAPPTTWEEFDQMAPKLTVDENGDGVPEQYAIALGAKETLAMYQPLLWNAGGGLVSLDGKTATLTDPGTIDAITFWADQVVNKKVSPAGMTGADADALFLSGKAAMEMIGPWAAPAAVDAGIDLGVAEPFTGPSERVTLAGATQFCVPTGVEESHRLAAYKFFAWWNAHDTQAKWAVGAGFPPNRTDVEASEISDNPYPALFGAPSVMSTARVYMAGVHNGSLVTEEAWVPALERILNQDGEIEEILAEANQTAQSLLDN
ncbi:MAG: ABC transporter substrate-binding protein [Bifidobacteriaceae bacterium]|nr:ABC transporter substrate-binding protein [Bifidobacteriaceae bacterium]